MSNTNPTNLDFLIGMSYEMTEKRSSHNFRDKNQLLLLLTGSSEDEVKLEMDELCFRLFTSLTRALKITVTIGISFIETTISEELYKQARKALELRFIPVVSGWNSMMI